MLGALTALGLWAVYLIVSSTVLDQLMWDQTVVPLVGILTVAALGVAAARPPLRRSALGYAVALPPTALVTFLVIAAVSIFFFGV